VHEVLAVQVPQAGGELLEYRAQGLGSGRIVASEEEAPIAFAILV
jgi:hypothetical protein